MRSRAAAAVVVCLLGFWALVLVGGSLEDGYQHSVDYVSALASRGAETPWVGVLAILSLGGAHLAAGLLWWPASRVVATALVVASASSVVVALARIGCPDGAAACVDGDGAESWQDAVHGLGVAAYEIAMLVALLAAAVVLARGRVFEMPMPGWAALSVALALGGFVALGAAVPPEPGGWQRLWLALHTVWLLVLGTLPAREPRIGHVPGEPPMRHVHHER